MGGVIGAGMDMLGIGDGEENRTTKTIQSSERRIGNRTQQEERIAKLGEAQSVKANREIGKAQDYAAHNAKQIDTLFRDALVKFSTGSLQPTPEQYAQATDFVDQTFTKGAETQYGRFLDQARTLQSERAAAMGRQSGDTAYEREFAQQANLAAQDLANQRGGLIAQRADELAYARPAQQLSALNAGAQYFNTPLQQAISNRLNLLNATTAQQGLGLQRQMAKSNTTTKGDYITPDASMGQKIGAFSGAMDDEFFKFANIYSMGAGMGGGGGGGGQYTYKGLPRQTTLGSGMSFGGGRTQLQ